MFKITFSVLLSKKFIYEQNTIRSVIPFKIKIGFKGTMLFQKRIALFRIRNLQKNKKVAVFLQKNILHKLL